MNPYEWDVLSAANQRLAQARRGEKAAIVAQVQAALGVSAQTAYQRLRAAGFESGRKRRMDARTSSVSPEELRLVSGVIAASANGKGQRMPVGTALEMLRASGQLKAEVGESTINRLLHARRLHAAELDTPAPALQIASEHPNHVWQIDSTTGAYYYMPGGKLRWMPEDEFYKNKPGAVAKAASDLLTRYAAADHASHAFKVRHYLGGETAANLADFVTWAMVQQQGHPMHGVPFIVVMDPGAANKGQVMRNLERRCRFQLLHHAAGAARVTGSVEKVHDLVRMHFDSRLKFVDRAEQTLDKLNAEVFDWSVTYCATRRHTRHGMTRFAAWMHITAEQLRIPASLEALREAATRDPESARVDNQRRISFKGKPYDLSRVPGVVPGLKVTVQTNVFRAPAIDVLHVDLDTGAETWHVVEPVETVGVFGFAAGAPVWGQGPRAAGHSDTSRTASELAREAYASGGMLPTVEEAQAARRAHRQAYAGVVDAMADVKAAAVPEYLPRRGQLHQVGEAERVVVTPKLSLYEAARRLKERLGAAYSPQVYQHLQATYGTPPEGAEPGVPEGDLDQVAALFDPALAPAADAGAGAPRLRAAGGES